MINMMPSHRRTPVLLLFLAALPALLPCSSAPAQENAPALLHGDRLFFVRNDETNSITVLDASTGGVVKRHSALFVHPGRFLPVGNDAVAVTEDISSLERTYVMDRTTGEVLWEAELPARLAAGDAVICVDVHDVIALDRSTGKQRWKIALPAFPERLFQLQGKLFAEYQAENYEHKLVAIDPDTGNIIRETDTGKAAGSYYRVACSEESIFTFMTDYTENDVPKDHRLIVKEVRAWSPEGEELPAPPLPADRELPFVEALEMLGAKPVLRPGSAGQYGIPAQWTAENDEFLVAAVAPGRIEGRDKAGGQTLWTYAYTAESDTNRDMRLRRGRVMDLLFALPVVFIIFFMQTIPLHATLLVSLAVYLATRKQEYPRRLRIGIVLAAVQIAILLAVLAEGSLFPPLTPAVMPAVAAANVSILVSKEIGWKKMLVILIVYCIWCLFTSGWRLPV